MRYQVQKWDNDWGCWNDFFHPFKCEVAATVYMLMKRRRWPNDQFQILEYQWD